MRFMVCGASGFLGFRFGLLSCLFLLGFTQSLSSEYIRLHRGDNKLLTASLDRIQQTTTRIIGLIEDDKNAQNPTIGL